eukprot:gene7842-676_t
MAMNEDGRYDADHCHKIENNGKGDYNGNTITSEERQIVSPSLSKRAKLEESDSVYPRPFESLKNGRAFLLFDKFPRRRRQTLRNLKVWGSAFGTHEQTKDLVAIVGGPNVCVCDCSLDMRPLVRSTFDDDEDLYCVAWGWRPQTHSRDVPIIAVAGKGQVVALMTCKGDRILTLKGHKALITTLMFHPVHKNILFSADSGGCVIFWIITWNTESVSYESRELEVKSSIQTMTISNDGFFVFLGGFDGLFQVLEFGRKVANKYPILRLLRSPSGFFDPSTIVDALVFVRKTNLLVAKAARGGIIVFQVDTKEGSVERYCELAWSPVNEYYFQMSAIRTSEGVQITCGQGRHLYLYNIDLDTCQQNIVEPTHKRDVVGHCSFGKLERDDFSFDVRGISLAADGRHAVITYDPGTFVLWETDSC